MKALSKSQFYFYILTPIITLAVSIFALAAFFYTYGNTPTWEIWIASSIFGIAITFFVTLCLFSLKVLYMGLAGTVAFFLINLFASYSRISKGDYEILSCPISGYCIPDDTLTEWILSTILESASRSVLIIDAFTLFFLLSYALFFGIKLYPQVKYYVAAFIMLFFGGIMSFVEKIPDMAEFDLFQKILVNGILLLGLAYAAMGFFYHKFKETPFILKSLRATTIAALPLVILIIPFDEGDPSNIFAIRVGFLIFSAILLLVFMLKKTRAETSPSKPSKRKA